MKSVLLGVGADPELFLSDGYNIVSAIGKVGGTKTRPKKLSTPGFYVQEDNVLVEFNIPPAKSEDEFSTNILTGINLLKTEVIPMGHDLVVKASHYFDEKTLANKKAKHFGCDPDYNAWSGLVNNPPDRSTLLRTAAGHAHIAYSNVTYENNLEVVKCADIFLGVPSILLDDDTERRTLYGKAGCFRHKPYGVEYRTLSSFWLKEEKLMRWVYRQIEELIGFYNSGLVNNLNEETVIQIITCIDMGDKDIANLLIKKFNIKMP